MRAFAALLIALTFIGCAEDKPADVNPFPKEMVDFAKKASANVEKQKAEEAAFLEKLKADPQPLFDLAIAEVKKGLAQTEGDVSADAATITIDKATLKTFGPEKWTVRGNLKAADKDGDPLNTTWEVTMQMMFGSLQTTQIRLQVEN